MLAQMDFPQTKVTTELNRIGVDWEELPTDQHRDWLRRWVAIYNEFYSPERRRLRGARAVAEAQSLLEGSFVLIPCRDPSSKGWNAVGTAYHCHGEVLPDLTEVSHLVDTIISPEDLSWTLLYGHEVDVFGGPDYSRADWHSPASPERAMKRQWD